MTENRTTHAAPDRHLVGAMAAIVGLELNEEDASAAQSILATQLEQGMQVPPEALQHLEPATLFSARWS
jgi:hypothetical protein